MNRLLLFVCLLVSSGVTGQTKKVDLTQGWHLRKAGETKWLKAKVPGTIHTDLIANKIIDDPFFESNELKLQWIDTTIWEYQKTFSFTPAPNHKAVYLLFEGLDTYAHVYLNDSLLFKGNNMFRYWKKNVKEKLMKGENSLRIVFYPTSIIEKQKVKELSYTLPGDEKVFTRKAAYHYGWDWGPRFVTCGIWKPVRLVIETSNAINTNHHFYTTKLTDQEATALLQSEITVHQPTQIQISVRDKSTETLLGISTHQVKKDTLVQTALQFNKPKKWWCNGQGEAHLYQLSIEITDLTNKQKQFHHEEVGLRTIELIQEADSIGKSFYFKLNGKPLFSKGANYIPPDNFLPRVTDETYETIVQKAKEANMNMLRVWGGGVYADDAFYKACDRAGILVWQDFMFACAMYPGDSAFIENVREEATQQVKRLRNHVSLALWCGNNEVSEGWYNWGWQKQYDYSKEDSSKIWHDYLLLFESVLPSVVKQYDQQGIYWPSSPQHGWGRQKSLTEGDSHYWGVWWGMQPFSIYNEKVGRFMSEYGFQGMPSKQAYASITKEKILSLQSPVVRHHQKHPTGFETIDHYLKQEYQTPLTFDDYRYVSQLVQADGMKIAIEAHRRHQPTCMGSLYWQLNDCWPVTSWSSVDYTMTEKASHYTISRAFTKTISSVILEKGKYNIYIISDEVQKLIVELSLQTLSGKEIFNKSIHYTSTPNSSFIAWQLDSAKILQGQNPADLVLIITLADESNVTLDRNYFYFTEVKNLELKPVNLKVEFDKKKNTLLIKNEGVLAKNIYLDAGDSVLFKNNFFDLSAGEAIPINFITKLSTRKVKQRLQIKTLYDTYSH